MRGIEGEKTKSVKKNINFIQLTSKFDLPSALYLIFVFFASFAPLTDAFSQAKSNAVTVCTVYNTSIK